jgi:proteasome lid subunit RPN8/RPN11
MMAPHFTRVTLPQVVAAALIAHAQRSAPLECCGLLIGEDSAIVEAVATENVDRAPHRAYTVDPVEHFRAIRTARQRGLQVIGAYHSHPASRAIPSETDRSQAFSSFLFVIVGLGSDPPAIGAWELAAGNFAPVPLVLTA